MTIKSQIDYVCPQCAVTWLPFDIGQNCPQCGRPVPASEVTQIISETLESARFNKRLYGKFELEYWLDRRLGDRMFQWSFKALDFADQNPDLKAEQIALAVMMAVDLEEMTPYKRYVMAYLMRCIEKYRDASTENPEAWKKMPEPEKPFFGRKVIEE